MIIHFKSKPKRLVFCILFFIFLLAAGGIGYPRGNIDLAQLDSYIETAGKDWSRIYLDQYRKSAEKEKQRAAEITKKKKKTRWPMKLEDYTGRYGEPMYGDARVSLENKKLVPGLLPAPVFISDLSHLHYDTFQLKLRNFFSFIPNGIGTVRFIRDKDGNVVEMKVDIPNHDFWFYELEFKKKK
jgi:hypothetical protein